MLWSWDGYHPSHPAERILPTGVMEITINLTDAPFRIHHVNRAPQTIHGAMVAGAQAEHFVVETKRPMSLLSVWFKPGGAFPFFGVFGDEIRNCHLPLETIWRSAANQLYEQLSEAKSSHHRFCILERALLSRLYGATERHRAIDYALNLFQASPHTLKISDVVDTIGLSSTRFIQLFRADVGMTPKQFCRIQRLQRTFQLMSEQCNPNLIEIALACGYYDQSHFINEFRRFTGITPSAYAPQSREHNTNLPIYQLS